MPHTLKTIFIKNIGFYRSALIALNFKWIRVENSWNLLFFKSKVILGKHKKEGEHGCTLKHKCASLLWESVYSRCFVHKRLWKILEFRGPSVCITLHILSPQGLGVLAFHVALQRRTPWQHNNKGAVPLSQDGCLRMKGGNAYLFVFSSQISSRNRWKNNTMLLVTACLHFFKIYKYFLSMLTLIADVFFLSTKECVSNFLCM